MRIFVPRETYPGETRVALTPDALSKLVKLGVEVQVESGAGLGSGFSDALYQEAGGVGVQDRSTALKGADAVLRARRPPIEEIHRMKRGALHIGLLDPFNAPETLSAFMARGVDAIAMEMIPRVTLAQKMDALSSQANLAGYVAVIVAAARLNQALPMMMTPAGTLRPARVFVVGAGVAGLQAIATAKRLGARVEAFDTRPVVEEQAQSLGAKFLKIDLGETGQTKDGYARELTEEQQARQRAGMARAVAQSDIVITTAQVFGRRAPLIVTRDMVAAMRPGSVVVDLAAETGGNVEGVELGKEIMLDGVRVIGAENYPAQVPAHASQMYAANLVNLITHFWDKESGAMRLDTSDEIMDGCLIIRDGKLRNEMLKQARETH